MRARLAAMTADERAMASLQICAVAARRREFREARCVALFAPLPTEPDIRPLIEEAWAERKCVALPFMLHGDEPRLAWHEVEGWDELVARGPHGIREPHPQKCPVTQASELDLVFVPGLAFDADGNRLGRGGGYYDRFLADVTTRRIGLFFAAQQVDAVPREAHDCRVDLVITELGEMTPPAL